VPEYSPHGVAEHAIALILALNRKIHRAHARVREGNFDLEGLLGFDLFGRTVGIIGTGKIGAALVRIMVGFGYTVLAHDPRADAGCEAIGARYVSLAELLNVADIVSLHCPLTPATQHLIDAAALARMRSGVMLINTSRGAVIDTRAVIDGLKSGRIGSLGLDVYEEEAELFFRNLSDSVIQDDLFARLLTFPNVLITGHQAFFRRTLWPASPRRRSATSRRSNGPDARFTRSLSSGWCDGNLAERDANGARDIRGIPYAFFLSLAGTMPKLLSPHR
jgi:D-lactate dehydrogenase